MIGHKVSRIARSPAVCSGCTTAGLLLHVQTHFFADEAASPDTPLRLGEWPAVIVGGGVRSEYTQVTLACTLLVSEILSVLCRIATMMTEAPRRRAARASGAPARSAAAARASALRRSSAAPAASRRAAS